jgi:hypothetical protein
LLIEKWDATLFFGESLHLNFCHWEKIKRGDCLSEWRTSMTDGNGNPERVAPASDASKYTLSITWNLATGEFGVEGLNVPPWVSLGMLRYMEILVRRRDAEAAMQEAMRNAPRISMPGRPS